MAKTLSSGTFSKGIVKEIYGPAYKMLYEAGLLRHLAKEVGSGAKGNLYKHEYFDPTTFSTSASLLTEANDYTTTIALTNASVIVYASEFGIRTDLTDRLRESSVFGWKEEAARQHAIACARRIELNILGAMVGGFTTGTVTGTSAGGFGIKKYMAAKTKLDAKLLSVPGRKHVVVHPNNWYYTAASTLSTTYASVLGDFGNDVIKKFYVRTLLGDVDIYQSNYITAATVTKDFMFVTDGLGFWMPRDFRLEAQRDASARADELVSTIVGGAKVLIAGYGCLLQQYGNAPS